MNRRAAITSIGRYLPPRVLDNKHFEKLVATNDEWIRTRTGISTRHHAEKGVRTCSELAVRGRARMPGATGASRPPRSISSSWPP